MRRLMGVWARFSNARGGNVAVFIALCMPVVIMGVGGAVDLHRVENFRSQFKDSLDSATLTVAREADMSAGQHIMQANLASRTDVENWTSAFSPVGQGRVLGVAEAGLKAHFLGIIGLSTLNIRVEAEAMTGGVAPPCLTLLDPNASQALLVNSGARLIASGCEVHVRSTANPAAIFNGGSRIEADKVCVAGSRIIDNGGRPDHLETSCAALADPFAGSLPTPPTRSCDRQGQSIDRGPVQLTPGVYCGGLNFNGRLDVNFAPGLYVIRGGDWNVNGGVWRGDGVTFYFEDSSRIQFNSGVDARLAAPRSGEYRNLLFFEKPGLARSPFIFNDSAGNELDGIMYLPSRNMTYNSGSSARGDRLSMVFNSLTINQATWRLAPLEAVSGRSTPRLVR